MADITAAKSSALDGNLVKATYKSTWNDFYSWEQAYCLRTLHSLARAIPQDAPLYAHDPVERFTFTSATGSLAVGNSQLSDTEDETFTIIDYTGTGEPSTATISVATVILFRVEPCAPYDICTPSSRNINVGDDSEYMPFIPLIDDPTFDSLRHAEDYKYFEWQLPFRDPDLEVILMQTAYTLHQEHKMSLDAIEETQLLPLSIKSPRILNSGRRR
ncbi:hypothetical protein H0H87_001818 [Tephrocybe sp. NHM501043]|nr:hypothetical protein H0H87_001818 [Tephrocybe sp. NHM501043]